MESIAVLLIEDNPADARLIQAYLSEDRNFRLHRVVRLEDAKRQLASERYDVVLLDLHLPDSQGWSTFQEIRLLESSLPILVLTGLNDEEVALRTVQEGAQDYLVKGEFTGPLLSRAIRYAIKRNTLQKELHDLSLIDSLTGVYNRRGFLLSAKQELALADHLEHGATLFYTDMDNMKWINDNLGHREGDLALIRTTNALQAVFSSADIIGRMGGDEFVVMALNCPYDDSELRARLKESISEVCRKGNMAYEISLSLGIVRTRKDVPTTLEALMAQADALMYADKKRRKEH